MVEEGGAVTTIGIAIPSIPPRTKLLRRAFTSAIRQTRPPDNIAVAIDHHHEGATTTRNRAWRMLGDVDLVALLDDDDELYPNHLHLLAGLLQETGADMVYPMFEVVGGHNPFDHFGKPWDPNHPVQTTITCLWRRVALKAIGGFLEPGDQEDEGGHRAGEDFDAAKRLNAKGGIIVHLPIVTWAWHHDPPGGNTSGLPGRWE